MPDPAFDAIVHGLGSSVGVRFEGERRDELASAFRAAWARCLSDSPDQPARAVTGILEREGAGSEGNRGDTALTGDHLGHLLQRLTQSITKELIEQRVGELLLLHAAALADPTTERALVCVAKGGTGKTTLTRTLGTRLAYLTDETAGIDTDDVIHPYPKPLSLRTPGDAHKTEASPDELGLLPTLAGARVAGLVLLDRDESCTTPRVERLGLLDAISAVAPESSSLRAIPGGGLQRLARLIASTGTVERWTYAEAETLMPLVNARLEAA